MSEDLRAAVSALEWYHSIELPGGVVTPGFFDHRPVLHHYEFPDEMEGLRALDVGAFDGFFAFEMERRGALVTALDVPDEESLDWPVPKLRRGGRTRFQPRHRNFDLAREALGSVVERRFISAYSVTPEEIGTFDYVFVGSVLIHLRDPVGALMALRNVLRPGGVIHICEETRRDLDLLFPRAPVARFQAISPHLTWWIPNRAAWTDMLLASGFEDVSRGKSFIVPFRDRRRGVRHTVFKARNEE